MLADCKYKISCITLLAEGENFTFFASNIITMEEHSIVKRRLGIGRG